VIKKSFRTSLKVHYKCNVQMLQSCLHPRSARPNILAIHQAYQLPYILRTSLTCSNDFFCSDVLLNACLTAVLMDLWSPSISRYLLLTLYCFTCCSVLVFIVYRLSILPTYPTHLSNPPGSLSCMRAIMSWTNCDLTTTSTL